MSRKTEDSLVEQIFTERREIARLRSLNAELLTACEEGVKRLALSRTRFHKIDCACTVCETINAMEEVIAKSKESKPRERPPG